MTLEMITSVQLAKRWDMNLSTLRQWRWRGYGPSYLKIGKKILYRMQDIEAFEQNRQDQNVLEGRD